MNDMYVFKSSLITSFSTVVDPEYNCVDYIRTPSRQSICFNLVSKIMC
jgi:hypothetical protein